MNRAQRRPMHHLHLYKLQDSVRYHRITVFHEKSYDFVDQCLHFVEVTLLLALAGDIGPSNVSLCLICGSRAAKPVAVIIDNRKMKL